MATFANVIKKVISAKKPQPIATQAPAQAPANPFQGFNNVAGQRLTFDMFPQSGFANQGARDYLSQSLGMAQQPQQFSMPQFQMPAGLQGFQGLDFGNVFNQLLGSSIQRPGQFGPAPQPMNTMSQFMGPMGNGGGYLTGKPFLPGRSGPKMRPVM